MKPVRDRNGKFAGSIGSGKEPPYSPAIPTSGVRVSSPDSLPQDPTVAAEKVWEAYAALSQGVESADFEDGPAVLACGCLEGSCSSEYGEACRYEQQIEAEFLSSLEQDALIEDSGSVQYVDPNGVVWAIREDADSGTVKYTSVNPRGTVYEAEGSIEDAMRFIDIDRPVTPLTGPPF